MYHDSAGYIVFDAMSQEALHTKILVDALKELAAQHSLVSQANYIFEPPLVKTEKAIWEIEN